MTDLPPPDLTEAARHMLGECILDACGEDVNLPGWVADEIAAEFDRRGTGDVDHWRRRALTAESRVDGQAWKDLEAERDRLRGDAENWKARFHAACTEGDDQAFRILELRSTLVKASNAATWERAYEIMEEALRLPRPARPSPGAPPPGFTPTLTDHVLDWIEQRYGLTEDTQASTDVIVEATVAVLEARSSPEAPAFTDLLADSSLGTPEALACRAVGREEIAKLRAAASLGAPTEIDPDEGPAFFAAAMAKHGRCWCGVDADGGFCGDCPLCAVLPPDWPCPTIAHSGYPLPAASSPPVQEHAVPPAGMTFCEARISPSWSNRWVRCGSLVSNGRCVSFGHGPAAQPPQSSPGEPPTGAQRPGGLVDASDWDSPEDAVYDEPAAPPPGGAS